MSTPEQPTPPLTRKQLRDLRNTAATPIITGDEPSVEPAVVAAPLPKPAPPAEVPPAPQPDSEVDLAASPLTRRQARQQERIRTASVPVITPDLMAAPDVQADQAAAEESEEAAAADTAASEAEVDEATVVEDAPVVEEAPVVEVPVQEAPVVEAPATAAPAAEDPALDVVEERPVVNSALGAELLEGQADAVELPASFDNLLGRGSGAGSLTASNALILSQTPTSGPLVGPVTATGEVLITGTFELPEGLGSRGHAPGVTDGKDIDAVLIDGELPPASSPTPIAASAAISTSKSAGEIIQPPAPEKGGRLMMALAITAGALLITVVGVFIFAITTGVFS